jgi:RHS repeat-associated protein
MRESPYDSPVDHLMLSDLLYRGTALVDADSGDIVEAYDTDAYGNTLIFSAAGTDDNWWSDDDDTTDNPLCPFIFTGRRYDPETEIYYYRARYYVPELGRFISRDPIGYLGGMSLYEYTQGKPSRRVDPFGLLACRLKFMKGSEAVGFALETIGGDNDLMNLITETSPARMNAEAEVQPLSQVISGIARGLGDVVIELDTERRQCRDLRDSAGNRRRVTAACFCCAFTGSPSVTIRGLEHFAEFGIKVVLVAAIANVKHNQTCVAWRP